MFLIKKKMKENVVKESEIKRKEKKEKKESKENELLLKKGKSKKKIKYSDIDILLLSDLDFYYKTGKYPFVLFTHILSTILITFIITAQNSNLNKLMQQTRAIEGSFYFHDGTDLPANQFKKNFYYTDYYTFSYNLVKIINNIYNINNTIDFDIHYINQEDIKLYAKFKKSTNIDKNIIKDYNGGYPEIFNITNSTINPIYEYFQNNMDVIKYYLTQVEEFNILLKYKYDRLDYGTCQIVNLNLIFDCSNIAYIKFYLKFEYDNCPLDINRIIKGFKEHFSILSLFLVITSLSEEFFIFKKIIKIIKIIFHIKDKLSKEKFLDNFKNEELFYKSGESKWDLIKSKDILNIFPKWIFIFVLTALLNTFGAISFLIEPFLTTLNRYLFGFGAFFSWICLIRYFQSYHQCNVIYSTLIKSISEYKFLFVTFIILMTGFCLVFICVNFHPGPFNNGLSETFISAFESTLGDITLYFSIFYDSPGLTLFLAFVGFILFRGHHIFHMMNVAQEKYQISNLETKKSWLQHSFDYKDYFNQQLNINGTEENDDNEDESKKDFIFDDAWMKAVLNIDGKNKLENVNFSNLKVEGLNTESIVKSLKKLRKNNRNKKISKEIYNEILEEEGNTDMEKLDGKNKQISRAFKNIEKMFYKIYLKVKKDMKSYNKEKFKEICRISIEQLEKIKQEITYGW